MFGKSNYWKNEYHSAVLRYGLESMPARFTRRKLYHFSSRKQYEAAIKYAELLDAYRFIKGHSKKANKLIQSFYTSIIANIKTFDKLNIPTNEPQ